jgi:hypothetical protein
LICVRETKPKHSWGMKMSHLEELAAVIYSKSGGEKAEEGEE